MGDKTNIAWTDRTFSRWWGCTKIGSSCQWCYAESLAKRTGRIPEGYKRGAPRLLSKSHNESLLKKWDRMAEKEGRMSKVFCHSMSDIFDQEVPDDWRVEEFGWMARTEHLWFQFLTKRSDAPARFLAAHPEFEDFFRRRVWLGTSLGSGEDIHMAHEIVTCPAFLHWISYEPAIGPLEVLLLPEAIRWVVIGGESGRKARPFDLWWADETVADCKAAGIKVFVKQLGHNAILNGRKYETHGDPSHGADPADWPEGLRVQEFPV